MSIDRAAAEDAERCLYCPKMCRFSCPVAHESADETLTPWGKMSLVSLALGQGEAALPGPLDRLARKARALIDGAEPKALDADLAEAFYGCTGCLRCRTFCEHDNDVPRALYEAREAAALQGLAPAGARAVVDRFEKRGHPQSGDVAAALFGLSKDEAASPGATSVLFAGCEAPLSNPASVGAALRAARSLKAPLAVAAEPVCCGRPLYEAGFRDAFKEAALVAWERLGDREVVTLSPACARALGEWSREVGVEPRGPVVHATTYLARRLGPDVQAPPLEGRALYHDPCHLGRGLGELDSPRRLLSAALQGGVVEAGSCREKSDCCGASGLVPETFPDVARAMAMTRADELRRSGERRVATACPSCRSALAGAGLEVVDVVELVADWLSGSAHG